MPHRTSGVPLTPEEAIHRERMIKKGQLMLLVALALLAGVMVGYAVGRIETVSLLAQQSARHVEEILRVRDEYGEKAADTRESVKQAARATQDAAQAVRDIAAELGPENARAARRATDAARRAKDAAKTATDAEGRVEEIMRAPETVKRPPQRDVPDWLGGG